MSRMTARDAMNSALTAVICTRDRPELLARALRSLLAQRHPPLEILVVDNAPSNELTRELLEREFPMVRYVREPVPGLDFARNRAIREATGRYLAFLDDDAVAGPDWAAAIEEVLRADKGPDLAAPGFNHQQRAVPDSERPELLEPGGDGFLG